MKHANQDLDDILMDLDDDNDKKNKKMKEEKNRRKKTRI